MHPRFLRSDTGLKILSGTKQTQLLHYRLFLISSAVVRCLLYPMLLWRQEKCNNIPDFFVNPIFFSFIKKSISGRNLKLIRSLLSTKNFELIRKPLDMIIYSPLKFYSQRWKNRDKPVTFKLWFRSRFIYWFYCSAFKAIWDYELIFITNEGQAKLCAQAVKL